MIAPLMISFMDASLGVDLSDASMRAVGCPICGVCRAISHTIFLLWLTCGTLLAGITCNIMGPSRTATQLKAGCFTMVFLVIFFMGVFHGVEKASMFNSSVPQLS
jgi:hypothetical protein